MDFVLNRLLQLYIKEYKLDNLVNIKNKFINIYEVKYGRILEYYKKI